jgi:hypothetical protein
VLNNPSSLTVGIDTDLTVRSALAYITVAGVQQLIQARNDFGTVHVDLTATTGNYYQSDSTFQLQLQNGVYPIRAVVATGLDGSGIAAEAQTSITVTGMGSAPQTTTPLVNGDISEFFDRAPLAVSAADGAGSSPTVADFGADGSLTELHARIFNNTLYLAVRGDMFNGGDPNQNATVVYIDVDATSGTGAKRMASPSDLSDSGTHLRQVATNSGFNLNSALTAQGIGVDAAVVIDATNPLATGIFGFGSGGVAGSPSGFADLTGSVAFGRGFQAYPGAAGTTIAGPSGFEVAIPLSQLGNANPLNMAFVAVTTSDGSFPSPNTLPENAQNTFDATQGLDGVAKFPRYTAVKVNEIFNGAPDWAELYNPGTAAEDLSLWSMRWADANGLSGLVSLGGLTIPAQSYRMVSDGPVIPSDGKLLTTNLPWHPLRGGSAAIVDPYGITLDYVRWSSTGLQPFSDDAPAGTAFTGWPEGFDSASANKSLSRDQDSSDTNQASDWLRRTPTPAARNTTPATVEDWALLN